MNFKWIRNEIANPSVTIYESNFTLNKIACEYFTDIRYVLLGYDDKANQLGIKPVTRDDIEAKKYPKSQLHKISIGKSYGRISNKAFIKMLSDIYDLDFNKQNGIKFDAVYDYKNKVLVVQL